MPWVANKLKLDNAAAKVPEYITNVEEKEKHEEVGTVEKMKLSKMEKEVEKN